MTPFNDFTNEHTKLVLYSQYGPLVISIGAKRGRSLIGPTGCVLPDFYGLKLFCCSVPERLYKINLNFQTRVNAYTAVRSVGFRWRHENKHPQPLLPTPLLGNEKRHQFSNKNTLGLLTVRENDLKMLVGEHISLFFWPSERRVFETSFVCAEPKLLIHIYRLGRSSKLTPLQLKCSC